MAPAAGHSGRPSIPISTRFARRTAAVSAALAAPAATAVQCAGASSGGSSPISRAVSVRSGQISSTESRHRHTHWGKRRPAAAAPERPSPQSARRKDLGHRNRQQGWRPAACAPRTGRLLNLVWPPPRRSRLRSIRSASARTIRAICATSASVTSAAAACLPARAAPGRSAGRTVRRHNAPMHITAGERHRIAGAKPLSTSTPRATQPARKATMRGPPIRQQELEGRSHIGLFLEVRNQPQPRHPASPASIPR